MQYRKTHFFTLVELLVVVGVIAVLSVMLFPAVISVRERARIPVCMSNIRQVSMLHLQYADKNRQIFCPALDNSFNQWDAHGSYQSGGTLEKGAGKAADSSQSEVFSCPESGGKLVWDGQVVPRYAGYGYNYLLSFANINFFPPNYRWVKTTHIRRPAQTVMLADAGFINNGAVGPTSFLCNPKSRQGGYADFRHAEKCIAAFTDGHVEQREKLWPAPGVPEALSERLGYLSEDDEAYDPFYRKK